jgi:hypothetical protein
MDIDELAITGMIRLTSSRMLRATIVRMLWSAFMKGFQRSDATQIAVRSEKYERRADLTSGLSARTGEVDRRGGVCLASDKV